MAERKQAFLFPLASKPDWVAIDPHGYTLMTLDVSELGDDMQRQALEKDEDPITRIRAARALGKKGDAKSIEALRRAVAGDRFHGVSAEAALALGAVRSEEARRALEDGLARATHPKVRRAIVRALGDFLFDEAAADALSSVLEGDRTWLVEAEAAKSLGRTRTRRAVERLEAELARRESWNDVIRQGVLDGLAATRDPRAFALARAWTPYGKNEMTRAAAVRAVGALADSGGEATRREALDALRELVLDRQLRVRIAAIAALEAIGDARALGPLDQAAARDVDGRVRRLAREARARVAEATDGGAKVARLREDLDQAREEARKTRDRLDRLEAFVESRLKKEGPVDGIPGKAAR
jgi:aminopeptidase N